jgi:hypothetical protein
MWSKFPTFAPSGGSFGCRKQNSPRNIGFRCQHLKIGSKAAGSRTRQHQLTFRRSRCALAKSARLLSLLRKHARSAFQLPLLIRLSPAPRFPPGCHSSPVSSTRPPTTSNIPRSLRIESSALHASSATRIASWRGRTAASKRPPAWVTSPKNWCGRNCALFATARPSLRTDCSDGPFYFYRRPHFLTPNKPHSVILRVPRGESRLVTTDHTPH